MFNICRYQKFICTSVFVSIFFLGMVSQGVALAEEDTHGRVFKLSDIKGRYGFSFQGEIVGLGSVAAVGVIVADGKGVIHTAQRTISVLGEINTQSFTCTYTIEANGFGAAVCPLDAPVPGFPAVETFDYVVEENGKAFRIVGTTPGVVIHGTGHK